MSITCCDFLSKSLTILASRPQKLIIFECELFDYNSLKLHAPMLSEITLVDNIVEEYEGMSMRYISLAHVSFRKFREGGISIDVIVRTASRLYEELKNAPQLFLNEWFIESLSRASDIRSVMETTSVSKLRRFTLHIQPIRKHVEVLQHILSRSPNLQELNIIVAKNKIIKLERWISFGLLNHLTLVNIHRFEGSEKEFEILRLLLESTPKLSSLNVLSDNEAEHQEISEKILAFKLASAIPVIEFHSVLDSSIGHGGKMAGYGWGKSLVDI
ncbi:hypothetical protein M9H77_28152 [Catharanthus roseus]|uniref:Uncharacterized protein n=1 Tax=Catharanthus roseus TaxID=4058 RepID=A0ACC0AFH5_CATRO|nr:hypothetical protein M9H77_28152 [Catharanthus roseus]